MMDAPLTERFVVADAITGGSLLRRLEGGRARVRFPR